MAFFKSPTPVGDGAFRRLAQKVDLELLARVAMSDCLGRGGQRSTARRSTGSSIARARSASSTVRRVCPGQRANRHVRRRCACRAAALQRRCGRRGVDWGRSGQPADARVRFRGRSAGVSAFGWAGEARRRRRDPDEAAAARRSNRKKREPAGPTGRTRLSAFSPVVSIASARGRLELFPAARGLGGLHRRAGVHAPVGDAGHARRFSIAGRRQMVCEGTPCLHVRSALVSLSAQARDGQPAVLPGHDNDGVQRERDLR